MQPTPQMRAWTSKLRAGESNFLIASDPSQTIRRTCLRARRPVAVAGHAIRSISSGVPQGETIETRRCQTNTPSASFLPGFCPG